MASVKKVQQKVALITGVSGQDGSYLAELLLSKNYEVHGIIRRSSVINTERVEHLFQNRIQHTGGDFHLHYGDLSDTSSLMNILKMIQPHEVYNLGAQSHVKISFDLAEYTANVDAIGVLRLLEAIRSSGLSDKIKFYQASTSEMYGKVREIPQTELTPFHPRSPYGVAKLYAYWIVTNYREAYGIFACNGILFNHESPRRGLNFVTRKITIGVAKIYHGFQEELVLGNLDAKRDWGHAKDYVEAMWLMLQQDSPNDFVIATGEVYSVRDFAEMAFNYIGVAIRWEGKGTNEIGIDEKSGKVRVRVHEKYYRPSEVDFLQGCSDKAKKELKWKPKIDIKELVKDMMEFDLSLVKRNPEA